MKRREFLGKAGLGSAAVAALSSPLEADKATVTGAQHEHAAAIGFVFDAHAPGAPGGGGLAFDWTRIPRDIPGPQILAGGLTCDNVGSAIRAVRPYAVDVSSGIESAPGIKDAEKMRRFVQEVQRACSDEQE